MATKQEIEREIERIKEWERVWEKEKEIEKKREKEWEREWERELEKYYSCRIRFDLDDEILDTFRMFQHQLNDEENDHVL